MAKRTHEAPYRVSAQEIPGTRFGTLKIEFVPTSSLKRNPRNAKLHTKKHTERLVGAIRRFGWTYPILIDEFGNVIAGHGRLLAAIALGLQTVPVIRIAGLSETERRALALADNKLAETGWDRTILAAELGELITLLPECDLDLGDLGFEPVGVR